MREPTATHERGLRASVAWRVDVSIWVQRGNKQRRRDAKPTGNDSQRLWSMGGEKSGKRRVIFMQE
ncbi:hypothetical protein CC1G_14476 [Coprinopsis cinerea okayama7|uniref:Uncharacterized protein n=1 Tax=Coprinopsis cinerea (strain Okayama-7 / 130 / ATCC MYA-4618 / FGSC 9003) TaxID=240176 RepID=D6RMD1_COPC7|nr:hypothetical protein CC1G_14476 [Coprinopsis cinerea okayama7\|eukprot:XP_002911478.1 hypothetical protein CC1G_14476 [Coprinopsis cinerea okayama7\